MKIASLIFNIVLLLFTFFVLVTDGLPRETSYIIFSIWILLTLILNIIVISRKEKSRNMKNGAIICNIVLIGFICWALVDEYPHPAEPGFIEYVVLMVLTPILSIVAFARKIKINNSSQVQTA